MTAPDPPVNVQLAFHDMTVPVDCRYVGWDADEHAHLWEAISPRQHELPSRILVERLPAHTSVTVRIPREAFDGE